MKKIIKDRPVISRSKCNQMTSISIKKIKGKGDKIKQTKTKIFTITFIIK